jgi:Tol biopolymer transport system component
MRASHRNAAWAALALAGVFAGCDGNTNDESVAYFAVTRRASLNSNEKEGNEVCSSPSISADGLFIAFASKSTNLHPDDTDLKSDIFVRDLRTGTTILASRATDGTKANGDCFNPMISANGRFVVFDTVATNLDSDPDLPDTDPGRDVYWRDLQDGVTRHVSRDTAANPVTGPDGALYAERSLMPKVSGDGRFVAFLFGDGTGAARTPVQVRLRDVQQRKTEILSYMPGLTSPFGRDCQTPALSVDGQTAAFAVDNGSIGTPQLQVFVRDRVAAETYLISRASGVAGADGNGNSFQPALSSDGQLVAFASSSTNLIDAGFDANGAWDIFVRNRTTNETVRVSNANAGTEAIGDSFSPALSADGRYVAFVSDAANLVNGDTNKAADVFVRDTKGRTTVRVSVRTYGAEANDASDEPAITADGSWVVFTSVATDLVEGDNNNTTDIFVRGPLH